MVGVSDGMRDAMRAKIEDGIITDARVWDLDLTTEPAPDERFDVIVTVMTLHHIPNLDPVLAGFARLLVEGGHLCVVDLREEDGSFHGEDFRGHHGFNPEGLAPQLTEAGFTSIVFSDCLHVVRHGARYPSFLATCVRGAAGRA